MDGRMLFFWTDQSLLKGLPIEKIDCPPEKQFNYYQEGSPLPHLYRISRNGDSEEVRPFW